MDALRWQFANLRMRIVVWRADDHVLPPAGARSAADGRFQRHTASGVGRAL
jgi:hypothetical protein